jgi:hypothetical protein
MVNQIRFRLFQMLIHPEIKTTWIIIEGNLYVFVCLVHGQKGSAQIANTSTTIIFPFGIIVNHGLSSTISDYHSFDICSHLFSFYYYRSKH